MSRSPATNYNDIPYNIKTNAGLPYNFHDLSDDQRYLFNHIYNSFITKREIKDKFDRVVKIVDERFEDITNEIDDMKRNFKLLED